MKRSVLIAIALISIASLAFAQAGSIGVFADAGGTSCNFIDTAGLVQVHFYHLNVPGATASQWRLDVTAAGWSHLGDMMNFPTVIGTSVGGISVGYGGCFPAPINLGMANFFGTAAAACTMVSIVPDPASLSGEIEGVDCGVPAVKVFPTGGVGYVNADVTCECNIPVEETTWGGVKALYQ
jgi:hypothetical protein